MVNKLHTRKYRRTAPLSSDFRALSEQPRACAQAAWKTNNRRLRKSAQQARQPRLEEPHSVPDGATSRHQNKLRKQQDRSRQAERDNTYRARTYAVDPASDAVDESIDDCTYGYDDTSDERSTAADTEPDIDEGNGPVEYGLDREEREYVYGRGYDDKQQDSQDPTDDNVATNTGNSANESDRSTGLPDFHAAFADWSWEDH
jgi:hypothetical protein